MTDNTAAHWLARPAIVAALSDDAATRVVPYTAADIGELEPSVPQGEQDAVARGMNVALEDARRACAPYRIAKTRLSSGRWSTLQQQAAANTALGGVRCYLAATGAVVLDFDASPARLDAALSTWREITPTRQSAAQESLMHSLVDVLYDMQDGSYFVLHIENRIDMADPYADNDEANSNVLAGIKCPACASLGPFMIDTHGVPAADVDPMLSQSGIMRQVANGELSSETFAAEYDDDGSTDVAGDSEFVGDGEAHCLMCGHAEGIAAFYTIHEA